MGDLIARQTEVLPAKQIEFYEKLLRIIDQRPALDWKANPKDHNKDFCLIKGNIEPTRAFTLKVQKIANYNMFAHEATTVVVGDDINVSVRVRLWDDESEVMATGGCSTSEVKKKGSGPRMFHDAVTIAETRGFKRALEAKAGLPFVNMIIEQLFGTFNIPGGDPGERDVTGTDNGKETGDGKKPKHPQRSVKAGNRIRGIIKKAVDSGKMDEETGRTWWNRILAAMDKPEQIEAFEDQLIAEFGGE